MPWFAFDRSVDRCPGEEGHKLLAVQHHPDKGGDPEVMTRFNTARDVLLEPEMEMMAA